MLISYHITPVHFSEIYLKLRAFKNMISDIDGLDISGTFKNAAYFRT